MSTNDTVLVLANGVAGNKPIKSTSSADFAAFQSALAHVCLELAKMIVRDGEGVHRVVTVRVEGAKKFADADAAARAVANSALVKTSWHGGDPNWGRIIDALGYSEAAVVEEKVDIGYCTPGVKTCFGVFAAGSRQTLITGTCVARRHRASSNCASD
jgi:glutamate N-acetyltransferase/amino-acid N-acetyltransferase